MYRPGHFGTALLVWAPVGGVLTLLGYPMLALLGGAIMVTVEQLPDYDMRMSLVSHRGITHTFVFALGVGALLGGIGAAITLVEFVDTGLEQVIDIGPSPTVTLVMMGFVFGTLGIVSHLAADVITPSGIPVLWPRTSHRYSYGLVYAKDMAANYILLVAGVIVATPVALSAIGVDVSDVLFSLF